MGLDTDEVGIIVMMRSVLVKPCQEEIWTVRE